MQKWRWVKFRVLQERLDKQDETNIEIKNWMVKQEESNSEIKNLLLNLASRLT